MEQTNQENRIEHRIENQIEHIGKFTLDYTFYNGADSDDDKASEEELLSICRGKKIGEALAENTKWQVIYNLSPIRENILEWYPFESDASLLEIGSGCGALTGLFGRRLKSVTCVEPSKRKSVINAYKNGENVQAEIYVSEFSDVDFDKKFDYVTMVDCASSGDKYREMLNRVKALLNDNGRLIIAIENKHGMKYWAGAAEDHTGRPFDGINDYAYASEAVTFTKPELEKLLHECGYRLTEFYYPVPDYKLPTVIYSDEFLPKEGDLRGVKNTYTGENYSMFDEEAAYDSVCRDGMFPYFANSFLVIAQSGGVS
jgi:2-polyprenyl-3-methyl-5-hydroxy-6-metoxy-1,4-benzoquinol methylase